MLTATACSAEQPDPSGEAASVVSPQPKRPAAPGVVLLPILTSEELAGADLPGELGCAFVEDGATGPVLIAAADVLDDAYAQAVMRLGMAVEPVQMRATDPGGFNAMVRGVEFVDDEFFARIVTTSDTPLDDSEAPPLPARMEFGTADSGTQIAVGQWSCGP